MKHILFLTWKDIKHPCSGGAEVVMLEYAKRLVQDGHKVTWFASNFSGGKYFENIDGIDIYRKYSINTMYFFAWKWYKKFKKSNKIDLILDEAGGIPLLSPLYEKNIPIYFFAHHIATDEYNKFIFPFNKLGKAFGDRTYKLYKNYPTITVSNSTKQELIQKFGFKNVEIVENAVNIEPIKKIDFGNKENEIVFLGRIARAKRLEESIKAFEKFLKYDDSYVFNIIGNKQEIEYFQNLEKMISDLKLEEKIYFIDYSKENVEKYLTSAKLMLVTSKKEGYGLVVLEGNSYGLPVLSYDVPGLRDSIKDGKNGYLIKNEDFELMGEKMNQILKDEKKYQEIANSSLEYIKNFGTWDDRYKEFKEIMKI
ncbi:MAG: glycosyltransferase family 4 protein [Candidatus Gracilibacteria bacterium]|nr:glycosyltransferase family 4 protein [Candidatus Gracilibacteria bacterium]